MRPIVNLFGLHAKNVTCVAETQKHTISTVKPHEGKMNGANYRAILEGNLIEAPK